MASVTRSLLSHSSRHPPRIRARQTLPQCTKQWHRPLSTTSPLHKESKASKVDNSDKPELVSTENGILTTAEPAAQDAEISQMMIREARSKPKKNWPARPTSEQRKAAELAKFEEDLAGLNPKVWQEEARKGKHGIPYGQHMKLEKDEDFEIQKPKGRPGFWAEGEEDLGPDEDYYGDDITSHGHGELEQHRELRHYARLIAWELPLLHHLARPFELPTAATPFRFRYTSYLGERHPATNKVVVEFSASDMPNLTPLQKDKLIKLAGPRYNPDKDVIKMSCELYDTQQQNKRFLGDTISKLLAEARDGKDTFADVPFDFRHHKPRVRHEWPQEWNLTPERKQYLEEKRQTALRLDGERLNNGSLVDGQKIIENSLPFMTPAVEEPVMVGGPKGKRLR